MPTKTATPTDYEPFVQCSHNTNNGFRCVREAGHPGYCLSAEEA